MGPEPSQGGKDAGGAAQVAAQGPHHCSQEHGQARSGPLKDRVLHSEAGSMCLI